MSGRLPLYPVTIATNQQNMLTIQEYDDEMRRRDAANAKTPEVKFYNGCAFIEKRPIDTEIADGKKQRVFYNQIPIHAKLASMKSAQALLNQQRPMDTREFPNDG